MTCTLTGALTIASVSDVKQHLLEAFAAGSGVDLSRARWTKWTRLVCKLSWSAGKRKGMRLLGLADLIWNDEEAKHG